VPSVPDTSGFEARPGPLGVACATGRRVTRMPHFSHPAIRRIAIDGRPACANVRNSLVDRREHREQLHWQHGRVAHAREVLDDPLVPDGRFGYPFEISQSAARAATVRRCRAARVRRSPTSCRPRGPLWDDWRRRARRERALETAVAPRGRGSRDTPRKSKASVDSPPRGRPPHERPDTMRRRHLGGSLDNSVRLLTAKLLQQRRHLA
jgi:hypothetical protein